MTRQPLPGMNETIAAEVEGRTPAPGSHLMGRGSSAYAAAEAAFTEYFIRNYPGPDTIIFDPKWHAPKLFAAAAAAMRTITKE